MLGTELRAKPSLKSQLWMLKETELLKQLEFFKDCGTFKSCNVLYHDINIKVIYFFQYEKTKQILPSMAVHTF